jgi:hypothetical protein
MSRYLILFLLNLPFILAAILSQVTQYKLGRSSKKRLYIQMILWSIILIGLASAEPVYNWLLAGGFTQTDSLSLFDVVQITAIVILFYIVNRSRLKIEVTERRLNDLHQELSIQLSNKNK